MVGSGLEGATFIVVLESVPQAVHQDAAQVEYTFSSLLAPAYSGASEPHADHVAHGPHASLRRRSCLRSSQSLRPAISTSAA